MVCSRERKVPVAVDLRVDRQTVGRDADRYEQDVQSFLRLG